MNAEAGIAELKKRIEELEIQLQSSISAHSHNAKEWVGRIAMQGAALYKASDMFWKIARNKVPEDMRDQAVAGFQLCDKALLEAGWPPLTERPTPPEGPKEGEVFLYETTVATKVVPNPAKQRGVYRTIYG